MGTDFVNGHRAVSSRPALIGYENALLARREPGDGLQPVTDPRRATALAIESADWIFTIDLDIGSKDT